jgi:hypothetical protein
MGGPLAKPSRAAAPLRAARLEVTAADERYRLHNLRPQEGARQDNKRKGRGYGGHQASVAQPVALLHLRTIQQQP